MNQLDNEEKYAILQYLEEEYDKNPEQFPFSKEQLAEIIEQDQFDLLREQIRQLQQKQSQGEGEDDENVDHIEAGQQQIEVDDGDDQNEQVM